MQNLQRSFVQLSQGPGMMKSITCFLWVLTIMTELGMEAERSGIQKEPKTLPLLVYLPLCIQVSDGRH
jgi:hypothetical protein